MEGSTSDGIESSSNSKSTPPSTAVNATGLSRMGSGATSMIIDSDQSGAEAESRKLPSSKYKGVVPQPNGRWGAQIYEKHHRVWLGTFNLESEAAAAYDVAAQRFRGRDAVTNYAALSSDAPELRFLNSRSKAEIVDMLRKHTYHDELQQCRTHVEGNSVRLYDENEKNDGCCRGGVVGITSRNQLFEKTVTPSDVGKLNRLVIPKQHAEKHFPLPSASTMSSSPSKGVLLTFEDLNRKVWRFRYSYWNSSQSYVLTKGWSRFVKEKGLKAGDVVIFLRSNGPDRQLYIDFKHRTAESGFGSGSGSGSEDVSQMLRLFGVDICKLVDGGKGKKRLMDQVELLAMESSSKKHMVVVAL